jgi:hypothetical protein
MSQASSQTRSWPTAHLGHLKLARAVDEHFDGAAWPEIALDDVGEAHGARGEDLQSLCSSHRLGFRVEQLDGRHGGDFVWTTEGLLVSL